MGLFIAGSTSVNAEVDHTSKRPAIGLHRLDTRRTADKNKSMATIKVLPSGAFQIRVVSKLLPKPFYASFDTRDEAGPADEGEAAVAELGDVGHGSRGAGGAVDIDPRADLRLDEATPERGERDLPFTQPGLSAVADGGVGEDEAVHCSMTEQRLVGRAWPGAVEGLGEQQDVV
ncbi:MAG: hypothetical protein ACXWVG_15970, partial [Telluria sp.]